MNHWQQTKQYTCPKCGATYRHDDAYRHAAYLCPVCPQAMSKTKGATR